MTKRKTNKIKGFTALIISISILFMSIGYAIINSIELGVEGEIIAKEMDGIYIRN